jgi:hypothetical protein
VRTPGPRTGFAGAFCGGFSAERGAQPLGDLPADVVFNRQQIFGSTAVAFAPQPEATAGIDHLDCHS